MANHTSGLFARVDLFSRSRVSAFYLRRPLIGNDRNIANCMQVVITARSFLLATAGLFVQSSQSLDLTVEVSRSINGLPDKFGRQVLYSC